MYRRGVWNALHWEAEANKVISQSNDMNENCSCLLQLSSTGSTELVFRALAWYHGTLFLPRYFITVELGPATNPNKLQVGLVLSVIKNSGSAGTTSLTQSGIVNEVVSPTNLMVDRLSKVLMLSKHTSIDKSFLVRLLALEAPGDVISQIRGDYGLWTAFLVFLVRLFYYIPGELELPFLFVLLVIIAPYQAMNLRGTQAGIVISIAASAYLIYQHVTRTGGIKKAFDQGVVVPTIAAACLICVSFIFPVKGYIF